MNSLQGLTLPLTVESGRIVDASGKEVLKANRESNETPLTPVGRDALIRLTCDLLNKAFEYNEASDILSKHGY